MLIFISFRSGNNSFSLLCRYLYTLSVQSLKTELMKRRLRRMVNFLGTNLLIFALYLNFFHRDKQDQAAGPVLKRPAFGDSNGVKDPIKIHQETGAGRNEQAALSDPASTKQTKL